jgi:hypothetical protein
LKKGCDHEEEKRQTRKQFKIEQDEKKREQRKKPDGIGKPESHHCLGVPRVMKREVELGGHSEKACLFERDGKPYSSLLALAPEEERKKC